jgi:hypothetical protein
METLGGFAVGVSIVYSSYLVIHRGAEPGAFANAPWRRTALVGSPCRNASNKGEGLSGVPVENMSPIRGMALVGC